MPFKELVFFAVVKREVVETQMHMVTGLKFVVIFTKVRAYLLYLEIFEFVSFYTQKLKYSTYM